MKKFATSLALIALISIAAPMVHAQDAVAPTPAAPVADPGHPRVNEVQQRIDNQQNRVDQGVSDGQINAGQASRDDAKLSREQNSLNQDEAKNGGHITKAEQGNLNHRLNHGSKRIHAQRVKGKKATAGTTTTAQ